MLLLIYYVIQSTIFPRSETLLIYAIKVFDRIHKLIYLFLRYGELVVHYVYSIKSLIIAILEVFAFMQAQMHTVLPILSLQNKKRNLFSQHFSLFIEL